MFDEIARNTKGIVGPTGEVVVASSIQQKSPNLMELSPDDENNNNNGDEEDEDDEDEDEDEDLRENGSTSTTSTSRDSTSRTTANAVIEAKRSPSLTRDRDSESLTSLRFSRRCRPGGRPLSGSSIASSTSSSGCSNQGNSRTVNPYLASVESLADTCASSQGSGDSGVVTVSETTSCGSNNSNAISRINGIAVPHQHQLDNNRHSPRYCPRYCDPQRNPVERVLLEIVDTEAIYVEDLRQVIQGYLHFWRNDPATLFRNLELSYLFSNIESIFEFNRKFLYSLEDCGLDPIAVANTFIEHNSGFKVYTEYCTNYPRTVSTLTDLMGHHALVRAFKERQAALGHALPLGSFLLKPVQRILKYHLLLENLSKEHEAEKLVAVDDSTINDQDCTNNNTGNDNLGDNSEGRRAIEGALDAMTGIAQHINAMKRKHEHAIRVQEIQSLLYGWTGPDLTTSGELIAEGSFRMRGAKAPRHVFLFERMLLLTKKKEDGVLVYKAHIMCSNLTLMESIPGEPLCFNVISFDNSTFQFKLQARNLEQKREWTFQIKRLILENYGAIIPLHARQLVLQIGQNKSEDHLSSNKNRKLERERRRSEASLRQKLKRNRKSGGTVSTAENSPASSRKNRSSDLISRFSLRDENLQRNSEIRGSKIKDRLTNWRRKSEPGFQSYVNLNISDAEDDSSGTQHSKKQAVTAPTTPCIESIKSPIISTNNNGINGASASLSPVPNADKDFSIQETKENTNATESTSAVQNTQTVEEIVSHILKQRQEFQKILDKQNQKAKNPLQRKICNRIQNMRTHPPPSIPMIDSSEDDESANTDQDSSLDSSNQSINRSRFVRVNNAYNQRSFHVQYDSFRNVDQSDVSDIPKSTKAPMALSNGKKKPNILIDSRLARTALRFQEDEEKPKSAKVTRNDSGVGHCDDLDPIWEKEPSGDDVASPTKPLVWLSKLCEDVMPTSPQKSGSLPRSFQINGNVILSTDLDGKPRLLQRDGKPMSDRPFTIASDKPADMTLESMHERKFVKLSSNGSNPSSTSSSTSTFFCSLMHSDSLTDVSELSGSATMMHRIGVMMHHHPEHKIYRAGSSIKGVLARAGNRLRNTLSSETLQTEEAEQSHQNQGSWFTTSKSRIGDDESQKVEEKSPEGLLNCSFDDIEYADSEEAFRDSAIFSDAEDMVTPRPRSPLDEDSNCISVGSHMKPEVTKKPDNLKYKLTIVKPVNNMAEDSSCSVLDNNSSHDNCIGPSQVGWVRKVVGQLQGRIET